MSESNDAAAERMIKASLLDFSLAKKNKSLFLEMTSDAPLRMIEEPKMFCNDRVSMYTNQNFTNRHLFTKQDFDQLYKKEIERYEREYIIADTVSEVKEYIIKYLRIPNLNPPVRQYLEPFLHDLELLYLTRIVKLANPILTSYGVIRPDMVAVTLNDYNGDAEDRENQVKNIKENFVCFNLCLSKSTSTQMKRSYF